MKSLGLLWITVMSWGWTKGVPRFYMFGEDLASAYVLHHQTSTVLEFQARDRQGFGGLDDEFEGQSMSISDWGTYMRIGTYKYQREHIRVRKSGICQGQGLGLGIKNRTEQKMRIRMETWNKMKIGNVKVGGMEFGDGWLNGIIKMTDRTDDWTRWSPTAHSTVTELGKSWDDLGCNRQAVSF